MTVSNGQSDVHVCCCCSHMQDMVKLVSEKLGQDAGTVLAAMLAHACRFETRVNVSDDWHDEGLGLLRSARCAQRRAFCEKHGPEKHGLRHANSGLTAHA